MSENFASKQSESESNISNYNPVAGGCQKPAPGSSEDDLARIVPELLPVGLALVNIEHVILWSNRQFQSLCLQGEPLGKTFYDAMGRPQLLGPDFCPFSTTLEARKISNTKMKLAKPGRFLNMDVSPLFNEDGSFRMYLIELRDVTESSKRDLQFERLRDAGKELADLSRQETSRQTHEERVNIIKAKITKFVREILHYQTIEIRLLSGKEPDLLEPLLAIEMGDEAKQRKLYARQEDNGITGWVAFHGKPYKMDDKSEDPFFLAGTVGTESSITVPLLYHGKVIGTFNVESNKKNAFTEDDLVFLELFARDVAQAIHTLDLFSSEQKDSVFRSISTINSEIIGPLSDILGDAARMLASEKISHDDLRDHLLRVWDLKGKIQEIFQKHGGEVAPEIPPVSSSVDCRNHPKLRGKRILVVDADRATGTDTAMLLFYYGCYVDYVPNGNAALTILENTNYDIILCNIKLEDMSAFNFLIDARKQVGVEYLPLVYMQEFGHDGGHVVVRSREQGFLTLAVYKPLILHQLLGNLERAIDEGVRVNVKASRGA